MSKPQGLPREPSRAEEDALVERILRGDKKAMDELVLGYTHAMSTFVRTQSRETLTAHEALSVAWDVLQMARVQWDATRYPHSRFLHYARWYIKSVSGDLPPTIRSRWVFPARRRSHEKRCRRC